MQSDSFKALASLQKKHRLMLLLSMVLFLTALFALVSHWTIAYPLIALSCVFYLVGSRLSRRRYTEAFTQALMEQALPAPLSPVSYAASEGADGLLSECGLIPGISCVPGAKRHHVLHGQMGQAAFSVSEAACVRRTAQHGMRSVAGTLVTMDSVLPAQENWLILLHDPFSGFCAAEELAGFDPIPRESAWPEGDYTVLRRRGGDVQAVFACLSVLLKESSAHPAALAAHAGSLSLLVPGSFYAPSKADPSKPVSPETMKDFRLPPLEHLKRMAGLLA